MFPRVLLLKGGSRSGWYGPPRGTHLPSSDAVQRFDQAQFYWRSHFAGKSLELSAHTKSGEYAFRVMFDAGNTHAFTRKAKDGEPPDAYDSLKRRRGPRVFEPSRATYMDRIPASIAHPTAILGSYGRDLYIGQRLPDGRVYVVVLAVKEKGRCEFVSAQPRSRREVQSLRRDLRPTIPAGLKRLGKAQKNGPTLDGMGPALHFVGVGGMHSTQDLSASRCPPHGYAAGTRESIAQCLQFFKSIPAGARWITVHPGGEGTKGTPVLIQEEKNGAARVIGGAGGKLNYLKLRGVKSEKEYKQEAAAKQKARREKKKQERKAQKERDKAAGVETKKKNIQEEIRTQRRVAEQHFIKEVSEALHWDQKKIAFDEDAVDGMSDAAAAKARTKHHRALLRQANEAVEAQRKSILAGAAVRGHKDLGEIPLEAEDPDVLSVQDLAPVPTHGGLGYATNYAGRAAERGLTDEDAAREKDAIESTLPEDEREQRESRRISAAKIRDELKDFQAPDVATGDLADAQQAMDLLKARKSMQHIEKQAREASKEVESSIEPKAYVLQVSDAEDLDAQVREDIQNELRTISTRAFLTEVGKIGGADYENKLGRHIGIGAYNAVNSLSMAASGAALVDRDVVDVMGVAGAAQTLARRLHNDLTSDEVADVRQALEQFHTDTYTKASEEASDAAEKWTAVAKGIEIDAAHDGADLAAMQELNAKRGDAIEQAQGIVGTALGEMEANAALVMALGQGAKDEVQASLGNVSIDDAIRRARAIGLDRGDYQINKAGANTFLTVSGQGLDKLAQPVDRDDLERTRGALDIIEGRADEDNWLPGGVADRPDLAAPTPEGSAPRLAESFASGPDMAQSIEDYIGGRTADGDTPADIVADLLSKDLIDKAGDRKDAYFKALDAIAPLTGKDGERIRAEAYQDRFEHLADAFVKDRYGNERAPLHRQHFANDQMAVDALHRSLADHPNGIAAFKPIGELTRQDQRALRDTFARDVAHADDKTQELRLQWQEWRSKEPEKEVDDMFGRGTNPAWTEWKAKSDELAEEISASGLDWPKYAKIMGGPANAYAAVQDQVRSHISQSFQSAYNTLNPEHPLKLGRTVIRGNLNHLDAVDPQARENRLNQHRQLVDSLRDRIAGRYASGSVHGKVEKAREAMEAAEQSQMGFFAAATDAGNETPLKTDERHTLGHAAERQIAGMLPIVGQNFKPNEPTRIWNASLNGKFINQQRAIRLIGHNKRLALAQGTGSGKTFVGLAGFTNLHSQGKVKRGLFLVPSIVQGQFSGEALRYLQPGKYKWAIQPGASRAQRIASYKDPDTHFAVVTHQSFRDDMLHLGAQQAGVDEAAMAAKLDTMSPAARKDWMRSVMDENGMDFQYLNVDEGHNLLNRQGKENSQLANVVDSLSANTDYYVNATADPIKNDASEAFDVLAKMDPQRYTDRKAFMRRYGVDTVASKTALRHELARYFYPGRIDPGVATDKQEVSVSLSASQQRTIQATKDAAARGRLARMRGKVDVDAMQTLSPHSFEGVDRAQHEDVAKNLQHSLGILKNTAIRRALNAGADNAKTGKLAEIANERRGKPGVVFAHSREAVAQVRDRLQQDGHRVTTITGADSATEKYRKKQAFRPEQGEAEADILICSDAGAVGLNAQRGQWLAQYDTPDTAMVHAQRNGRIHRIGQKNNVELIDLVADHPAERKARRRLSEKYALRDVMTSPLNGLDDTGVAGYLNQVRAKREQQTLI